MTMELCTLGFPIYQIYKHKVNAQETTRALALFDAKRTKGSDDSECTGSIITRSTGSKGKMYPMETLDQCLASNHDGLQVYASCVELNGENILFLSKCLNFKRLWFSTFTHSHDFLKARMTLFRAGLSMYVSLVHSETANYPINIESPVYAQLEAVFGHATTLVAGRRKTGNSSPSTSQVTPWDEPAGTDLNKPSEAYQMRPVSTTQPLAQGFDNESSEHIISKGEPEDNSDPLAGFRVPIEFDSHIFDAAYKSVKYMVWSETWQRYMNFKRSSGISD